MCSGLQVKQPLQHEQLLVFRRQEHCIGMSHGLGPLTQRYLQTHSLLAALEGSVQHCGGGQLIIRDVVIGVVRPLVVGGKILSPLHHA